MLRQLAKLRSVNLIQTRSAFITGYTKPYVQQFNQKPIQEDLEASEVLKNIQKPDFSNYKVQRFLQRSEKDKQTHALLIQAEERREKLQLYQTLSENQFYLMNIPSETKVADLRALFSPSSGLIDLKITRNGLQQALYATATFSSLHLLEKSKQNLENVWLQDKLLKVKTLQDKEKESFDDRTVAAKGIPKNWTEHEIKEHFGQFGHIMGIELPQYDKKVREMQIAQKATNQLKKQEKQRELAFQKALASQRFLFKDYDTQIESQNLQQLLQNEIREKGIDTSSLKEDQVLRDGRKHAIWRSYVALEAEKNQIQLVESEVEQIRSRLSVTVEKQKDSLLSQEEKRKFQLVKEDQAEVLKKVFEYFKKNPDQIEGLKEEISLDISLQKLQRLSQQEVGLQIDFLLNNLKRRQELVQNRLYDVLQDLHEDDKVVFENANYNKELEKVAPVSHRSEGAVEDGIPISQQIEEIKKRRQIHPKRAFYEMVTNQYNPFTKSNLLTDQVKKILNSSNMGQNDIDYQIDEVAPQSVMRKNEKKLVAPEFLEQFEEYVEKTRQNMDISFDEVYHREKEVVQDIIRAEKELKEAQANLPDIMSEYANPNGLQLLQDQALGERHPAERIRQQASQQRLAANLGYKPEDESSLDKLLREGKISEKDYDRAVEMQKRENLQHLGYCFITYTHRDEAIVASALDHHLNEFDSERTEVMVKGYLDHQDFDPYYYMQKLKNEGQLEFKRKALREAKQNLRKFEENFDEHLPRLESLKAFREEALQLLERGNKDREWIKRTSAEEQQLYDKMRQLQRENKEIDFTVLFQSEKSMKLRKRLHKRAFKTYKEYEFLKAGLIKEKKPERKDALKAFKKQANDYAYPAIDKLAEDLFTDKIYAQNLDYGEQLDTQGRRFKGYTQQELEQMVRGKDGLRQGGFYQDHPAFGFNEDFKKRFPKEKYLDNKTLPRMNKQLEEANQLSRDELGFFSMGKEGPHLEIKEAENMKQLKNEDGLTMAQSQERLNKFKPKDENQQKLKAEMQYKHFKDFVKGRKFSTSNKPEEGVQEEEGREETVQEKQADDKASQFSAEDVQKMMQGQSLNEERQLNRNQKPKKKLFSQNQSTKLLQRQIPFEQRLQENRENNKIPVDFSSNYEYAEKEYSDPATLYHKLYESGLKEPEQVLKQASIDGFMPEITEKVRRDNYEMVEQLERKLMVEKVDDQEMLQENLYRSLSIKAGSEKPEHILAYVHRMKDYIDLQADFDKERTEFHDEIEQIGSNPLINWASRRKPQTKYKRLGDMAQTQENTKHTNLYEEYRQKLNEILPQSKKHDEEDKVRAESKADLLADLKKQAPRAPSYEEYFESRAQGKDPLDVIYPEDAEYENRFTDYDLDNAELFSQDELLGAFYNQTMTSEQFYQWKKHSKNPENFRKMMEDKNRNLFIKQNDIRRLSEERFESMRRRKVMDGEWTEEESRHKIREIKERQNQELPTARRQRFQERVRHFETVSKRRLRNPHELHEREYYFDSGYGESLQDHVSKLKQQMPNAKIEVRQDQEGFHIIKTSFKKEYKYNLDQFLNGKQRELKEVVDAIFQALMGGDKPDQDSLRKLILAKSQQQFALDSVSEEALTELVLKFKFGGFDSRLEFVEAFREVYEKAEFDQSKPVDRDAFAIQTASGQNINYFTEKIAEKYEQERRIIQQELNEQIMLKLNHFMYFKEREASDFVKLPVSEQSLFEKQLAAFSENDFEKRAEEEDLGLEEKHLQKLKREIRERRETKEKLLQQQRPNISKHLQL